MSARFAVAALLVVACGKIDPNATGSGASKQVGDSADAAPPSASSGNAAVADAGKAESPCVSGLTPYQVNFDNGVIAPELEITNESALSIDNTQPIAGAASLRVDPSFGFVTYKVPNTCGVRLEFTVRTSLEFSQTQRTLAMIDAGARRFIIWVNGTTLALMQSQLDEYGYFNTSSRHLGGELLPDVPTTITAEFDEATKTFKSSVHSSLNDVPLHPVDIVLMPGTPPASVVAVKIGSVPGVKSEPSGTYWLDDIKIE